MKIALLQANVGGIDNDMLHTGQVVAHDSFYYHSANLPFPLSDLNNRMKAKYLKLQTHRFLPGYDAYIWIDGRFEIKSPHFVSYMMDTLGKRAISICKHPSRNNTDDEFAFIFSLLNKGNKYLTSRYQQPALVEEQKIYTGISSTLPLYACGIFARWNNDFINNRFDAWWDLCLRYSSFDQCLFSHVFNMVSKTELDFNYLTTEFLNYHKHK